MVWFELYLRLRLDKEFESDVRLGLNLILGLCVRCCSGLGFDLFSRFGLGIGLRFRLRFCLGCGAGLKARVNFNRLDLGTPLWLGLG
jgi:hypothetical protein